jgi:hypothetical protein
MKSKIMRFSIVALLVLTASAAAAETTHQQVRRNAQDTYTNGNWQDAFELYRKLNLELANDPKMIDKDFARAWQCLRQLNRVQELDEFREAAIERHADNWRLLLAAARSYSQNSHWGYMVAGEFQRDHKRGGGKYVNAVARDRVRALQLMQQAMAPAEADPAKTEAAQFYLEFARIIQQYRGTNQAWRLQYLTDLTRLPDYEPGWGYEYEQRNLGAMTGASPYTTGFRKALKPPLQTGSAGAGCMPERWRWIRILKAMSTIPGRLFCSSNSVFRQWPNTVRFSAAGARWIKKIKKKIRAAPMRSIH